MEKLLDLLKMIFGAIASVFLYKKGAENKENEIQAKVEKQAREEATQVLVDGEKIREKYNNVRTTIPNAWPDYGVRKTDKH